MDNLPPEGLNVSRETLAKLEHYAAETLRWNGAINLISKSTESQIWQRHIWDSAQLFRFGLGQGKWLDLGSGGGFPGLVMAIMGAKDVTLVETDQRKAAFLRETARRLCLPVHVLAKRIDEIEPQGANTITARALAPLTGLMAHAARHIAPDGVAIFPKGRNAAAEIVQAQQDWQFDLDEHPSQTEADAKILLIRNIKPQ